LVRRLAGLSILLLATIAAIGRPAGAAELAQLIQQLPGQQQPTGKPPPPAAAAPAPATELRGAQVRQRLPGTWEARLKRADGTGGTLRFSFTPRFSNSSLAQWRVYWDDGKQGSSTFDTNDLVLSGSRLTSTQTLGTLNLELNPELTLGTGSLHLYGTGAQPDVVLRRLVTRIDRAEVLEPERSLDWQALSRPWSAAPIMRGNMPRILVRLHGTDLPAFEEDVIRVAGRDDRVSYDNHAVKHPGERGRMLDIRFVLMPEPPEQPHAFQLNGAPFTLDLRFRNRPGTAAPPLTALLVVDAAGKPIDRARPGQPFRLQAIYGAPHPAQSVTAAATGAAVTPPGGASGSPPSDRRPLDSLSLERAADGRTFLSPPLAFAGNPAAEDRLSFSRTLTGFDPDRSARVVAQSMSGTWSVQHQPASGPSASGSAILGVDGRTATLTLQGTEGERRFQAIEIDAFAFANPAPGEPEAMLSIRFAEDQAAARSASPLSLTLAAGGEALGFKLDALRSDVALDAADGRFRVMLLSKPGGQLEGAWSAEKDGRDLVEIGRQSWTSGATRIAGVVVLEDQLSQPTPGQAGVLATMAYPFGPQGDGLGSKRRTLFVWGENLPTHAERAELGSPSPYLTYEPEYVNLEHLKATGLKRAAALTATSAPNAGAGASAPPVDGIVVRANLSPGIAPGRQELTVNRASIGWPLVFSNQIALLRFVREGGDARADPTASFTTAEIGFLELAYDVEMPLGRVGIELLRGGDENLESVGVLRALPIAGQKAVYRTTPIHFHDIDQPALSPPGAPDALRVGARSGMRFSARLADPAEALLLPPPARVEIVSSPNELGPLWEEALRRVARCYGDDSVSATYAQETATLVERSVLGVLFKKDLRLLKGDHAAAIILRDAFQQAMGESTANYSILLSDPARLAEFWARAAATGNTESDPFWSRAKATWITKKDGAEDKREVPLWRTLDAEKRSAEFGMRQDEAQRWALDQTRAALAELLEQMRGAVEIARDAGDCDLARLLAISGQNPNPMVPRVLPRLMQLKQTTNPPGSHWEPDRIAQGFVKGLGTPGEAVRALEEYSAAADAVASSVLALATLGGSAIASGIGYAGAAVKGLLLAADVVDLAYFGSQGALRYRSAEQAYDFARGAAPVLGAGALEDAEAARQSAILAGVGLLAPGLSGVAAAKQLKNVTAVQRGRVLAQGQALDRVSSLTGAERADLAAYYADLMSRSNRNGRSSLGEAERAALELLDKRAPTAAATQTRPRFRTTPMSQKYAGEHLPGNDVWGSEVRYLSDAERQQHKLVFREGKIYHADGRLFDTSGVVRIGPSSGRAIFAMDENGELYASLTPAVGKFHHSSLLAGQPVAAAGELRVRNGVLELISDQSGHYSPSQEYTQQALAVLQRNGIDLRGVTQELIGE